MSGPERKSVFKKIATQFVVNDVIATAEYYQKVLGFELLSFFGDPPVYAMLARDAVEMHFGMVDAQPAGVSNKRFRDVGSDAYIWVDDIGALFDEFTTAGADIIAGPIRRVYNSTEIEVRDCNGFTLVFGD
jgi:predicted enzyme related to lactoylglutathione lyase